MFPNVLTFSITVNGQPLDVSRMQPAMDRVFNALLDTEDPVAELEAILLRVVSPRPLAPVKRPKRKAGEVLADVARGVETAVEAAAPVVASILSKRRGA